MVDEPLVSYLLGKYSSLLIIWKTPVMNYRSPKMSQQHLKKEEVRLVPISVLAFVFSAAILFIYLFICKVENPLLGR